MTDALIIFAHLLGFVYWVGADIAVFYGAGIAADPKVSAEARETIGRLTRWVDQFPRSAVPVVLVSGVAMAQRSGYLEIDVAWVRLCVVAAITWIFINLVIFRQHTAGASVWRWSGIDLILRSSIMVVVGAAGLAIFTGIWPAGAPWLATKMLLFAATIAFSLAVRHLFAPFRPALARIVAGGARDDDYAVMRRSLSRTRVAVSGIWICAAAAALIGIWKPT